MVYRRYNDFVSLHELLLARFPYRLIPKLPPKKIVGGNRSFDVHLPLDVTMNFSLQRTRNFSRKGEDLF